MARKSSNKVAQKPARNKMVLTPKIVPIRASIQFTPKTENQKLFIEILDSYEIVVANGPSGVGKSYTAIAYALKMLFENKIKRIILTRPAVNCGEEYGAIPGEISDKLQGIMSAMMDILEHFLGESLLENWIEIGKIEIKPLGWIRGLTFNDCVIIGDELQNISKLQCYALTSRIGENSKLIMCGDLKQCDIPLAQSGLLDFVKRTENEPDFGYIEFTSDDCVRSGMAKRIIEVYEKKL